MNILIKKELESVKKAIIPKYEDSDLSMLITKGSKEEICNNRDADFVQDGYYKIKFKDYIVHPYPDFDLHTQWNNGIIPQEYIYNVQVVKVMGKMIKVDGVGCEKSTHWVGWIPKVSAEILEVLE